MFYQYFLCFFVFFYKNIFYMMLRFSGTKTEPTIKLCVKESVVQKIYDKIFISFCCGSNLKYFEGDYPVSFSQKRTG